MMSIEDLEEEVSGAERQKALLYYGSGVLALTEQYGDIFHEVDEVFVVKELCLHCFIDFNVSLEDDTEEARLFEKTFQSTRMKHIYIKENCSNRYHARANSLIWEELLQELNMFKQVVLLEQLQWLFDTEMTRQLSSDAQDIVETIKSKLVVYAQDEEEEKGGSEDEEKGGEEGKEKVAIEANNGAVEERGAVSEEEVEDVEEKTEAGSVESEVTESGYETSVSVAAIAQTQNKRKARDGVTRGKLQEGMTGERRSPLSTLERSEYFYIPAAEGESPLDVVEEEKREEIMTGLDIVITETRILKHDERFDERFDERRSPPPRAKRDPVKSERRRKAEPSTGGSKWYLTRHGVWKKS